MHPSGSRLVGIVHSWTKATEFFLNASVISYIIAVTSGGANHISVLKYGKTD
jgi:hypothetical protein